MEFELPREGLNERASGVSRPPLVADLGSDQPLIQLNSGAEGNSGLKSRLTFSTPEGFFPPGRNPYMSPELTRTERLVGKFQRNIGVCLRGVSQFEETFEAVLDEAPRRILYIPAIEHTSKLGDRVYMQTAAVAILLDCHPDAKVFVVGDKPEFWNSSHPRLGLIEREHFRKLFHAPQLVANGRIQEFSRRHGIDCIVNVSKEYPETTFDDATKLYVSLSGTKAGRSVRAEKVISSPAPFRVGCMFHILENRTEASNRLVEAVTGRSWDFRRELLVAPEDADIAWLRDELGPFTGKTVLVNFFGSGHSRSWFHISSAVAFIERVLESEDTRILLAPAMNEKQAVFLDDLMFQLSGALRSRLWIPSKTSLRALKQMIHFVDGVATVDTGLAHLSEALGNPPLVFSIRFARLTHGLLTCHPAVEPTKRRERNVFGTVPSRFNPRRAAETLRRYLDRPICDR